jgi:hypothetical protein
MAEFEQTRLSTGQTTSFAQESHAPAEGTLSVRVWKKTESAGPPARPDDPARCLILDLISASQGVVSQSDPQFVSASFPGAALAVLAARRLQWAMQGLAQSDPSSDLAAAILVHEADDLEDPAALESAQAALAQATPGQILVSAKAAEDLKDVPSLPLQAVPESALYELVWRSSVALPNRSLDEEAIEALIKQHGLESEVPPVRQEPAKPVPQPRPTREIKPASRETKSVGAYPAPAVWEEPEPVAPSGPGGINPRLLYAGGGGVLVLIAVVCFFIFSHGAKPDVSQPATPATAAEQTSTAHQASQPATKTQKQKPNATAAQPAPSASQQKPSAESPKDSGSNVAAQAPAETTPAQQPQPKEQPKEKSAGCTLDQGDIPKLLGQADNNRAAGRYEDAVRQYNRVLACGENARARNGLEITRLAMQHQ